MTADLPAEGTREASSPPKSESESLTRALHRATLSLFTDLSLDGVLQRITAAAKDLAKARYAALGIPDGRGGLEAFITQGLSEVEILHIPHRPLGKGLIGEMMRTGQSIRIREISEHPSSVGFPPGHPHMRSFLGVPIAAYGRTLGQIYLTDKLDADEFSEQDRRLIEMLASHAAAAIENARLYRKVIESEAELSQRNEELELVNSLGTAVSSPIELDKLLENILDRVIELFEAQGGEIFLQEENQNVYQLAVRRGNGRDGLWRTSRFRRGEGIVGRVAETGKLEWSDDLSRESSFLRVPVRRQSPITLVGIPLTARGRVAGVLTLLFPGSRPIAPREAGLLGAVGGAVGVAAENARLYRQARRLAVLEERERIGMDLHDGIIQSIYAVGLTLDYARILVREAPTQAGARISQAIDGLNAIIRDIRAYILDLRPARIQTEDLAASLARLGREFRTNTLVEPDLKVEQEAVSRLETEARETLFHIAQEALANIAKHAGADKVWISLRSDGDGVLLQVIDNGKGFDKQRTPTSLGHGLINMAERAGSIGGDYEVLSSPGEGTTITVHIPTHRTAGRRSAREGVSSPALD